MPDTVVGALISCNELGPIFASASGSTNRRSALSVPAQAVMEKKASLGNYTFVTWIM
jgi:hypothetical protein